MRETDARMAKYSRRGLIFNFFAFLVIVAPGQLIEQNPKLMLALTMGLAVITLLRGFFLFRFDQLYPRAPTTWRNRYFVATLIGAVWWGVILASVTLELGMKSEATLLWMYTVIFFSTTAHAFAPYQKFLSYYQFLGQVPAAFAAFFLGSLEGYLYGAMMLGFYFVLTHQCRLISENYWERLEATYALARKTLSIEEEKRDTRANVELNQEFMKFLFEDIDKFLRLAHSLPDDTPKLYREEVQRTLLALHSDIGDFNGVLSKELVLENHVFNIRHEIQHLVAEFIDDAESRKIQIETSLSSNLPMRLKGDAPRLAQIIRSLLSIILQDVEKCIVLVEVEFLREYETAGELYITVTRSFDKNKKLFFNELHASTPQGSLGLVVAKGLADMMNGSIEVNENIENEQQFRFNGKIDIAEQAGQMDFHKDSFIGKNVLLVHNHPRIVDLKRQELDALGFNVYTETQYKRALQTLLNSYKFQNPIESLLFYIEPDNQAVVSFCEQLAESSELKYTRKVGSATRKQQQVLRENGFDESHGFYYVDKPTGLFEVESVFYQLFRDVAQADDPESLSKLDVLAFYTVEASVSPEVRREIHFAATTILCVDDTQQIEALLRENDVKVMLLDCDHFENIAAIVRSIRAVEQAMGCENYLPVIGVSGTSMGLEETAYELGLDDYVDLTHNPKKTLSGTISYWSTLLR